jgi:hypothetical protein
MALGVLGFHDYPCFSGRIGLPVDRFLPELLAERHAGKLPQKSNPPPAHRC